MPPDFWARPQPRAGHGSSLVVTVSLRDCQESLLLDAGTSADGLLHNLAALGVKPKELRGVVLSHGHFDHTGGLLPFLDRSDNRLPVYIHPDALLKRKVVFADGSHLELPPVDHELLSTLGVELVANRDPSLLLGGHALLTGGIERTTDFERGTPAQQAEIDGRWQPDPLTNDDQALVIHVEDQGLVVITGCGHAGIVNTLRYAQKVTGVDTIYAVIGGFYLGGGLLREASSADSVGIGSLQPGDHRSDPLHRRKGV